MTKDQLISLLQQSKIPGSATVQLESTSAADDDTDPLIGDVTGVIERDGKLVIEGSCALNAVNPLLAHLLSL